MSAPSPEIEQAQAKEAAPRKMCDHICMLDDDHVERGEPHFYGYEIPSPLAAVDALPGQGQPATSEIEAAAIALNEEWGANPWDYCDQGHWRAMASVALHAAAASGRGQAEQLAAALRSLLDELDYPYGMDWREVVLKARRALAAFDASLVPADPTSGDSRDQ